MRSMSKSEHETRRQLREGKSVILQSGDARLNRDYALTKSHSFNSSLSTLDVRAETKRAYVLTDITTLQMMWIDSKEINSLSPRRPKSYPIILHGRPLTNYLHRTGRFDNSLLSPHRFLPSTFHSAPFTPLLVAAHGDQKSYRVYHTTQRTHQPSSPKCQRCAHLIDMHGP
jgi:hypothetical protein